MLYKIGITGSIGSGKSTVSKYVKERGFTLFDADEIARNLTSKDSPIVEELSQAFGLDILDANNELDRRKLAKVAFSTEEGKETISKIVTQKVVEIIEEELKDQEVNGEKLSFVDAPLLFECNMMHLFDEVWTVVADYDIRFERAYLRDGISKEDFEKRNAAQFSDIDKMALSDVVFHNNEDKDSLHRKVRIEVDRVLEISCYNKN